MTNSFSALEHDLDGEQAAPGGASPLRLDVLGPQGETLRSLDLTEPALTVGQAPGNQLLLDAEGVSRYHMRLSRDGARVIVTDLGGRSGTMLNEQRLAPHAETPMAPGGLLRVGPFRLRLSDPGAARTATTAVLAPDAVHSAIMLSIAGGRETLELTPGQPTVVVAMLTNNGDAPDGAILSVEGIPPEWLRLPEAPVAVAPGSPVSLPIQVLAPREPTSRASEYAVTLRARAQSNPTEMSAVSARWTVLPFAGSELELRPRKRIVRGLGAATYVLAIENSGNQPDSFTLRVGDDEPSLDYQLDQGRVTLEPGATATVRLGVQARENPTGRAQNYNFSVRAQPGVGTPLMATAQLTQQRPFPIWLVPVILLGFLALVASAAGLIWWLGRGSQVASASQAGITQVAVDGSLGATITTGPVMSLDDALHGTQTAIAMVNQIELQQTELAGAIAGARAETEPTIAALSTALANSQALLIQFQAEAIAANTAFAIAVNSGSAGGGAGGVSSGGGSGGASGGDSASGSGSSGGSSGSGSSGAAATVQPTYTPYPTYTPLTTSTVTPTPTIGATSTSTSIPTVTPTVSSSGVFMRFSIPLSGGMTAGSPITAFAVELVDISGNRILSLPGIGKATAAIAKSGCTATTPAQLSGTKQVDFVAGVAIFQDLTINCVGKNYTLQISTTGGPPAITSSAFDVVAGSATALAFEVSPDNAQVGAPLVAVRGALQLPVKVIVVDALGNPASPTAKVDITISITGNPAGVSLGGTKLKSADQNTPFVEFDNLTISKLGTYTLTASSASLTQDVSASFQIIASKLVFDPATTLTAKAGDALVVKVNATDAGGVIVDTGFTDQVTLTVLDATNTPVGAPLQVNGVAGVATFNLAAPLGGGSYTLQASASGYPNVTRAMTITAKDLVIVGTPQNTVSGNLLAVALPGTAGTLEVQALDGNGVKTSLAGTVTLTLLGGPGAGANRGFCPIPLPPSPPAGTCSLTTTAPMAAGSATFSNLMIANFGQGYTIQATIGTLSDTSGAFNVTASRLAIAGAPVAAQTKQANQDLNPFTVNAVDALGNTDTNFAGTLTFALSGGTAGAALSIPSTAITGGSRAVSTMKINRVSNGAPYTITITSAPLTGTSFGGITITASQLQIVGTVPDSRVNTGFAITVRATDGVGIDTSFGPTLITLTLTDNTPALIGALRLGQGGTGTSLQVTFNMPAGGTVNIPDLRINRVGQGYTLAATGGGLSSPASNAFDTTADRLTITGAPATRRASQTFINTFIRAVDGFGNIDTTYATSLQFDLTQALPFPLVGSSVAIALVDSSVTPVVVASTFTKAMTGGVFEMNQLAIDKVSNGQSYTITITTSGPLFFNAVPLQSTTTITPITVTASELRFVGAVPNTKVNTNFPVTIQATDSYGTQDTSFAGGTITLTLTDNTPALTGPLKLSQGAPGGGGAPVLQTTFTMPVGGSVTIANLRINRVGQGYTLAATGVGLSSPASNGFNIQADRLVISAAPTTARADAAFGFTVRAEDGLGNRDTTFPATNLTLGLTGGDPAYGTPALPGTPALNNTSPVMPAGGTVALTGLTIDRVSRGTDYTITVSGGGLTADTTTIAITASQIRFITPLSATAITAGNQFDVTVHATDSFGTIDTSFGENVLLEKTSGPGALINTAGGNLPPCRQLNNGAVTFNQVGIDTAGAYTITANAIQNATCPTGAAYTFTPFTPPLVGTSQALTVN